MSFSKHTATQKKKKVLLQLMLPLLLILTLIDSERLASGKKSFFKIRLIEAARKELAKAAEVDVTAG